MKRTDLQHAPHRLPPFAESSHAVQRDADVVRHPRKASRKREGREEEGCDGGSPLAPSRSLLYLRGAPVRPDECVERARRGVQRVLRHHPEEVPQLRGQGDLRRQCPPFFCAPPPPYVCPQLSIPFFFAGCDEGLPLSRRFLQQVES
jgi:hypothetical protein